jgi:hypothetical protein
MRAFMRFHAEYVTHFCGVIQQLVADYIKQKRELTLVPEDVWSSVIRSVWEGNSEEHYENPSAAAGHGTNCELFPFPFLRMRMHAFCILALIHVTHVACKRKS